MLITLNTQTFDLDGTVELDVTLDRGDQVQAHESHCNAGRRGCVQ